MGANHPGEIKTLANIALPTCGLITNVGKAHLEGFGSLEGVINTKKELYENLAERGGHVFVNANNELLLNALRKSHSSLLTPHSSFLIPHSSFTSILHVEATTDKSLYLLPTANLTS